MIRKIYKKLLRDYYAAQAMQADISRMPAEAKTEIEMAATCPWEIARRSFEMADEMMIARNAPKTLNQSKNESIDIVFNKGSDDEY